MMGSANIPARAPLMAGPVRLAVISPQFCAEYPVNLTITGKLMTSANGTFGVTDFNGNIIFTVKSKVFSLHASRVLLDSAGNPIITFQQKLISAHRRWKAFRGESTDAKDLLFSVKKSSMFRSKGKLDVFLAANTAEEICDFKIDGNWSEGSCVICAGNTNNIIAQVYRFKATVNPNIDYAFIVALIFILGEINSSDGGGGGEDGDDGGGGDGDGGGGGCGGGGCGGGGGG